MSETYDQANAPMRRKVKPEPPAPPPRDFDKEQGAINQILNALAPFPKEVQATLIKTVVVFKDIYIPRDI